MTCPLCQLEKDGMEPQTCCLALAEFRDKLRGFVWFVEFKGEQGLLVHGQVSGILPIGKHGFHVHQYGNIQGTSCADCGGHWNPSNCYHGGLNDPNSHIGDLGNIVSSGEDGVTKIELWAENLTLTGPNSIAGRSIVIHADEDDLGKGDSPDSLTTGNSGIRLGCAVIGLSQVPPRKDNLLWHEKVAAMRFRQGGRGFSLWKWYKNQDTPRSPTPFR